VPSGPRRGERVLAEEEDLGHALVQSLDEAQRKTAIIAATAPGEIVTTNRKRVDPLQPAGIAAAQLTPGQREQLLRLVRLYVGRAHLELAEAALAKINATGFDQVTFAWAGVLRRGTGATCYPDPGADIPHRVR
jgi:hypothetical protein